MDEERRRRKLEPRRPQREFWRAVLTMRNHLIVFNIGHYWDDLIKGRGVEGSLWEAINIVGNHLESAIADGLLDDGD